jgi:hypothetical protein
VNAAEQEVLRICRTGQRDGHWVMRELRPAHPRYAQGACAIIDVARCDSPVVYQGADWDAVLQQLRARP